MKERCLPWKLIEKGGGSRKLDCFVIIEMQIENGNHKKGERRNDN